MFPQTRGLCELKILGDASRHMFANKPTATLLKYYKTTQFYAALIWMFTNVIYLILNQSLELDYNVLQFKSGVQAEDGWMNERMKMKIFRK